MIKEVVKGYYNSRPGEDGDDDMNRSSKENLNAY
jgi:hypothetical protein